MADAISSRAPGAIPATGSEGLIDEPAQPAVGSGPAVRSTQTPGTQTRDSIDAPQPVLGRTATAQTRSGMNGLARTESTQGEASRPSFFHTILEILEFAGRIFFPIVNLISALIRIARLAVDVLSGKPDIDWTHELMRLAGDLIGTIPGFGVAGAAANLAFNYWFDQHGGDHRQGAQILGGANYFVEGPDVQSSAGYYFNRAGQAIRGVFNGRQSEEERARVAEETGVRPDGAATGEVSLDQPAAAGPPPSVSATGTGDIRSQDLLRRADGSSINLGDPDLQAQPGATQPAGEPVPFPA